ncbi:MAG: hypothetical protein PHU64_04555 [Candidatus Omnitrophica bacterium]|nr:hypothetical protein [Candidatus Omnitrophota bacterium]MDD5429418.1 hypothetical protein [Candidatus Omnitrophota bacterium]
MNKGIYSRVLLSVTIFLIFSGIILAATIYYSPGWGFMDDSQNISIAEGFWKNNPSLSSFKELVSFDISEYGRFRPFYQAWVIFAYRVFFNNPLNLYVFIAIFNLLGLLLWGLVIHETFSVSCPDSFGDIFIYPLSFFIFTPFWNNFMYISLLEKFVYIFSAVSLYLFISAYRRKNILFSLASLAFAILCILSKETGVALLIAYWIYYFFTGILFKTERRFCLINFFTINVILAVYYLFIRSIWGNYSMEYSGNLNPFTVFINVIKAQFVIKGITLFSVTAIAIYIISRIKNKNGLIKREALIFPLFLGTYIAVLSPWKFSNYLLAPIAPMIMGVLYPLYVLIGSRSRTLRLIKKLGIISIAFLVLFFIIVPRISKMADKRKLIEGIKAVEKMEPNSRYFFPPPFSESSKAIQKIAVIDIEYLDKGILNKERLNSKGDNYLIFGDQCSELVFRGVAIEKEVYRSNTWKIFLIGKAGSGKGSFKVAFPENFVQKMKNYLKEL